MLFLQPRDPRWHGPQVWYFRIDVLKNIVLTIFAILVIVETSLHRKWYNAYYDTVEYDSGYSTSSFFIRIGMALLPDAVSAVITQTLMNMHHHPPYSRFHPVYAITQKEYG
ncbi:hypothetical protein E8E13_004002 [Curvularia kusanoi]|uniref:Uncharacterized protein n=1 Tax=Curvularia kusanoi TaxID=90978 RepID=A0A9P4W2P2_CURKU|nr:hypothetical protein E8E13_004002 [Curvularia kusanoi]